MLVNASRSCGRARAGGLKVCALVVLLASWWQVVLQFDSYVLGGAIHNVSKAWWKLRVPGGGGAEGGSPDTVLGVVGGSSSSSSSGLDPDAGVLHVEAIEGGNHPPSAEGTPQRDCSPREARLCVPFYGPSSPAQPPGTPVAPIVVVLSSHAAGGEWLDESLGVSQLLQHRRGHLRQRGDAPDNKEEGAFTAAREGDDSLPSFGGMHTVAWADVQAALEWTIGELSRNLPRPPSTPEDSSPPLPLPLQMSLLYSDIPDPLVGSFSDWATCNNVIVIHLVTNAISVAVAEERERLFSSPAVEHGAGVLISNDSKSKLTLEVDGAAATVRAVEAKEEAFRRELRHHPIGSPLYLEVGDGDLAFSPRGSSSSSSATDTGTTETMPVRVRASREAVATFMRLPTSEPEPEPPHSRARKRARARRRRRGQEGAAPRKGHEEEKEALVLEEAEETEEAAGPDSSRVRHALQGLNHHHAQGGGKSSFDGAGIWGDDACSERVENWPALKLAIGGTRAAMWCH